MERETLPFYLQAIPVDELQALCRTIESGAVVEHLQQPTPQTLLVPVEDPVCRKRFISGEVLVTSAVVRVNGHQGWAMVMDDRRQLAAAIATLDGAFSAGVETAAIRAAAERGRCLSTSKNQEQNRQVESTRVCFDLL